MTETQQIISHIIELARQQGMDQKQLAQAAQISAETLSRLKKADDVYFSTLSQLARVVGMKLTLAPKNDVAGRINEGNLFQ